MKEQLWFVELSKDWSWLRRTWFVAAWPLWFTWARLSMWWYRVTHRHEVDVSQELDDAGASAYDCMLASEEVLARDWTGEENDKWYKAVEQELEEHAGAWERLAEE